MPPASARSVRVNNLRVNEPFEAFNATINGIGIDASTSASVSTNKTNIQRNPVHLKLRQSLEKRSRRRKKRRPAAAPSVNPDSADSDDQHEADNDSDGLDSDCPVASSSFRVNKFRDLYGSFRREKMYILPSGDTVESVLYRAQTQQALKPETQSKVLDWVLDLNDPVMKAWFQPNDWAQLEENFPDLDDVPDEFIDYLGLFNNIATTQAFRAALEANPFKPPGEPYSRDKHLDLEWAHGALYHLLQLLEDPSGPLQKPHLEGWYGYNVWAGILDKCLRSLPGLKLERTESTLAASAKRRNSRRSSLSVRARMGPRMDGILRSYLDDSIELLVVEAAASCKGGETSSKWLSDGRKVMRSLRETLGELHYRLAATPALFRRLQVVGVTTAGLTLQVTRMVHTRGYVCVVRRDRALRVPAEPACAGQMLEVLLQVLAVRNVVRQTWGLLREGEGGELVRSGDLPQTLRSIMRSWKDNAVEVDDDEVEVPMLPAAADTQSSS